MRKYFIICNLIDTYFTWLKSFTSQLMKIKILSQQMKNKKIILGQIKFTFQCPHPPCQPKDNLNISDL